MKPTENPNIFDFATSELSQDAFICYMLNFDAPAKLFLEKCNITGEKIVNIKRQYSANTPKCKGHIDILVETEKHYLIIEDKTGTNEHGNQIQRYCDALLKDSSSDKNKPIHACYVKTDYLSEQEKNDLKEKHPISFICLKDLLDCCVTQQFKDNSIAKQWYEHFVKNYNFIQEELTKELSYKTQNDKRIYLDRLTTKIKKETDNLYKDAWWFLASGADKTPHIELCWPERKKVTNHWGQPAFYVMPENKEKPLRLVVKYHFYDAEKGGSRIKTPYSDVDKEKLEEIRKNLPQPEGWKVKNVKKKDLLMLIEKEVKEEDLINTLKAEKKNIEKIFAAIEAIN